MNIREYQIKVEYTAIRDHTILVHASNEAEAFAIADYMFYRTFKPNVNTITKTTILGEK